MRSFTIGVLIICLHVTSAVDGQNESFVDSPEPYSHSIVKSSEKITLDGRLDEKIWQTENYLSDFWMAYPVDKIKAKPNLKTQVWVTFDDDHIYIAAICYGPGPYLVQSLKRDGRGFWDGDTFAVILDPVNERSNGFNFATNPSGVQYESLITGQTGRRGGGSGSGFNTAWDNKWLTETMIYSDHWTLEMAIPFKSLRFGPNTKWGANFLRGVSSENSFHAWSPVPVEFYGVDLGYTGILEFDEAPKKAKSNISIIPYVLGSTFKDSEGDQPADNELQIGGDAKIAINSNLNLDLTINPDFSQVEVDQQVTNLTTVNLRFPERRLFFLENSDIYSDFGIPPMRPFFSRRIGLDDEGNAVPILYGARLSGNLDQNTRIGVMNLQTRNKSDSPGQNYTSVALHRRVFDRSTVKGYFHNRQGMIEGEFASEDYNRTMGLEFDYRSLDGRWRGFGGYGLSFTDGVSDDNYFYNTGASYSSRNFSFSANISGVGNNYITDMGFIPRINHYDAVRDSTLVLGFHHSFTQVSYTIYPENPQVISHQFEFQNRLDVTKDGWELIESEFQLEYTLSMTNTSLLTMTASHTDAGLLFPFGFTDAVPLPVGKYSFDFVGIEYKSDERKPVAFEAGIEYGGFYNGTRSQFSLGLSYRQQPWGNFGINFVQNNLDFPEPYGNEKLVLIGPRIELSFSRDLFWTTFLQYNTQRDNFNINSRLQWRFEPLSDLFLVYTDNYSVDIWGAKNRAIVLKMNYWINL